MMHIMIKTRQDVEDCKALVVPDLRAELIVGAEVWSILVGGQSGEMSRFPSGRGSIATGGDSSWGDWIEDGTLRLDDTDNRGHSIRYNETGECVTGNYIYTGEGE